MAVIQRRSDRGLGATAAGGNGGSFAGYERGASEPPTPVDGKFRSADEFRYALNILDQELEHLTLPNQVKINAVGGFALMCHNLREDGYTVDIDTITSDYGQDVREAINRVASDLELERDWINNEAAGDDAEQVSNMLDAVYLRQDFGFKNIDLSIADLPTLTRAKAFAVSDSGLSSRSRDWDDLLDLVDRQAISSKPEFDQAFPTVREWEYPEVHVALQHYFLTGDRAYTVPEEDFDIDEFLSSGEDEWY